MYKASGASNGATSPSDPVVRPTTTAKTTVQATTASSTAKPVTNVQATDTPQAGARGIVESRRIGCFADVSQTQRMLNGANVQWNTNTPDVCWNWCASKGFLVAGVAYGSYVCPSPAHGSWLRPSQAWRRYGADRQCFCGNTIDWSLKKADSECNRPCAGDSSVKCGGANLRLDVYTQSTNIEVGQPAVPSSGRKYLWAHHMVGNVS